MVGIIQYLIKEKLVVGLLIGLIYLLGFMTISGLNRESFPEVSFDMVSIKTVYPGGSPDELESLITIPIEKKLREIDGIEKVRSYNIENVSVLAVYIEKGHPHKDKVIQDIKDSVDLVEGLPDNADDPVVEEIKVDKTQVIDVAIIAKNEDISLKKLRDVGDGLEDFLYDINGVAEVEKFGFYDREFLIEVDPGKLAKYRLGMNDVTRKLSDRNIDLPGGPLRIGDDEYTLRTKGQFNNINEVLDTVIVSNDAGYSARIRDIATVKDTVEEPDILERYTGKRAVVFRIWKKRSADELVLADKIKEKMKVYVNPDVANVKLEMFNDRSEFTRNNIESVVTNAITGFILLAAILFFFLGMRMAIIVTATIPLVFMFAFIGMGYFGVTLNVVSLFGMIMVLGMIVDFGIVISENAHRYYEMGMRKNEAIMKCVKELVWPVTVTFLCISAAFTPLMLLTGIMGKFIKYIPMVVMICLAASWIVALFLLPSILDSFMKGHKHEGREEEATVLEDGERLEKGLFGRVQLKYMKFLKFMLKFRYVTVLSLFLLLVASLKLLPVVGFVFFPGGGSENIEIKTYLPNSRNLDANLREIKKIEAIIGKLPKKELECFYSRVGTEVADGLDPKPGDGTHKSTIFIYLTPEKDRDRIASEIEEQLRRDISTAQSKGEIAGNMRVNVAVQESGPPVGDPINIEIRGKDFDTLNKIAGEYISYLKTVKGVFDIRSDFEPGKTEFRYKTDELLATRAKLSVRDIATSINASFEGAQATTVRDGEDEITLRVRFNENTRKRMKGLNEVMISNNQGGLIPLGMVTKRVTQPGYSQINRLNYKRIVQVKANVDLAKTNSMAVNKDLAMKFSGISKKYPDYFVSYGGEQEDTKESLSELGVFFQIALVVIFIILAVFFKSLMVPFVVMSAIPFAFIGVIGALFLHGEPLCFMSILALFSLAGVIVSNTVTLVEFINLKRDEDHSLKDAIAEAAVLRLRPIILTTGTTVLGLLPSIYGIGDKNYMVAPLALGFGYGLIFATVITLVLVPCFYNIAEDVKRGTCRLLCPLGIHMRPTIFGSETEEGSGGAPKSCKKGILNKLIIRKKK